MKIFVTVGTHEDPFDRLVAAAERLGRAGHEVVVQSGTSAVATPHCQASPTLTPDAMQQAFAHADVVIAHGGPSTLLEAAAHGHVPILVPRRSGFGEHVDEHQLWVARRIADRVHVVEDPAELVDAVEQHRARTADLAPFGPDAARTREFARSLEALCEELVSRGQSGPRRRGRLTALKRWMQRPR